MTPAPANPYDDPWRGDAVARWLAVEAELDRMLTPFGAAALARAAAAPGERVLDVGCGAGPTTVALAAAVGASGHVLGVDIAGALLARARERAEGLGNVAFLEADAQTAALAADRDLVFSRFGVMFFADPAAAFRNLAGALVPGGRLAFVCWRTFQENPWLAIPFLAMCEVIPDAVAPPVDRPGPFGLADAGRVRALLAGAGFTDIAVDPVDHAVRVADDLPAAVRLALGTGPVARGMPAAVDEETRGRVAERIGAALAPYASAQGVMLDGAAWVVSGVIAPGPGPRR
jgi:SAM-dependent methyltransferase